MKTLLPLIFSAALSAALAAEKSAAITPRETIALFNGKDLSNFTT